jgi:hypothetical protein
MLNIGRTLDIGGRQRNVCAAAGRLQTRRTRLRKRGVQILQQAETDAMRIERSAGAPVPASSAGWFQLPL